MAGTIAPMSHPQSMSMLRLLAALSWADGVMAEAERMALGRLIAATDLDDEERAEASRWISSEIEMDEAGLADLSENRRLATYQAAVRMAYSDEELSDSERTFLDRVRTTLEISEADAAEIEDGMPKHD